MLSEPMNAIPSPSICPSPWLGDIHKIKELRTDSSLSTEERSIAEFLYSYRGSHATFNAYRREIERLLLWANHYAHKSIGQLTHLDMEQFIEFCQKPPKSWIGLKQSPRFIEHEGTIIPNPEWRPFVVFRAKSTGVSKLTTAHYQLSQKAVQSFFSILGSFFSFLLQENKVQANPMAQIRQKSKFIRQHQHKAPIRRLSELQWSYVIETAEQMAKTKGRGPIESTRQIRAIVQYCFDEAIECMKIDGFKEEAEQLKSATVHWLRHTGISEDVKHRPREHVRDEGGHESIMTTDRYIDDARQERARSGKNKVIKPDD